MPSKFSFLNSFARFPDTLPCCHGEPGHGSYRHIWPHSPLEDMREKGDEVEYWIRYLDLIKQWVIITKAELAALDEKTSEKTSKALCKAKEAYPASVGQDRDLSIFLSNFGPLPPLVPCCPVCCDHCPIRIQELRRQEAQSWTRYYDSILRRMMETQAEEAALDEKAQEEERKRELEERRLGKRPEKPGVIDLDPEIEEEVINNMALADPDPNVPDDEQSDRYRQTINQLLVLNAEARQLTKECIQGVDEGSKAKPAALDKKPLPNDETPETPDVRLSLDICRHLFKQLVPPDLDEEEHELSAEPCRLAFNQVIMTNADARQLTKDCIDGIEGLLEELQAEAEALRLNVVEEDQNVVVEEEDEDNNASYDWMKDLMSADKMEGEDGEIPAGLSEYWRYSKAYFHLYL
ncbi:hypothetical protein N0V85_005700 [Neurospora sp. IMI 360204]|nr:hypothetical protein N0V85_005700 [Neurospora sp. IMI 360204]